MKVYIKNKFWSLGGGSSVVDENKQPIYNVKGRFFSPTRVKWLCDLNGNKLYKIRNKWLNFFVHKAYIYDANKTKIATVKDKWFNVNQEYFILGYKDEIKVEGKFFGLNCQILKNGEVIGWFTFTSPCAKYAAHAAAHAITTGLNFALFII